MRLRLFGLFLIACAVLSTAASCDQSASLRAVVASSAVYESLAAVQDAEDVLFKAGKISPTDHQKFNAKLLDALVIGRDLNRVILNWRPGQPSPPELTKLATALRTLSKDIVAQLPIDSKAEIQTLIASVYDAVFLVILITGR